jgi:hypothetical protein
VIQNTGVGADLRDNGRRVSGARRVAANIARLPQLLGHKE